MSDDVTADPLTFGELDDGQPLLYGQRLLSSLYREIGLAAVAIELNCSLMFLSRTWPRRSRGAPLRYSTRGAAHA